MAAPAKNVNLNTVLLSIVLALSAWTLKTVFEMSNNLTAVTTRVNQHDSQLGGLYQRVTREESDITDLRLRLAATPAKPQ